MEYTNIAVELRDVRKVVGTVAWPVVALDGITLQVPAAAFTVVMGPSGSGKSTLLHVAAGLDEPTEGDVLLEGSSLGGQDEAARARLRRRRVGFVFQQFNLLPSLTVHQNATLPLRLDGRRAHDRRVREILARVGLGDRADHRPAQLSGGERQRAAIARALLAEPAVIFADEPTGALDSGSAREVLQLFGEAVREHGQTVVMVTHDPVAAAHADAVVFLADGRLRGALAQPTPDAIAERMTQLGDVRDDTRIAA